MVVYIEKQHEIEFINKIREIYPSVKIENQICEYKPINEYLDPICDNCAWEDYNDEIGHEYCSLKIKEL